MKILQQTLCVVLILFCVNVSFAQKKSITGKVSDSKGAPLAGVSVKVKSTPNGTITNNEGFFKIDASSSDVLEFTIVGYQPVKITVGGQSSISVTMTESQTELGEVVLIGSRKGGGIIKTETTVPVDIININQYHD